MSEQATDTRTRLLLEDDERPQGVEGVPDLTEYHRLVARLRAEDDVLTRALALVARLFGVEASGESSPLR